MFKNYLVQTYSTQTSFGVGYLEDVSDGLKLTREISHAKPFTRRSAQKWADRLQAKMTDTRKVEVVRRINWDSQEAMA